MIHVQNSQETVSGKDPTMDFIHIIVRHIQP